MEKELKRSTKESERESKEVFENGTQTDGANGACGQLTEADACPANSCQRVWEVPAVAMKHGQRPQVPGSFGWHTLWLCATRNRCGSGGN